MKLLVSKKHRQLGAALLVAMCISAFLCICITGYLSLAEHQNYMSARSQAWNISISVTEAGIEEGLTQLNCADTNLASHGWTYDGSSYYRSNNLPDGNSYTVNIWRTNAYTPVIISRAYTVPPTLVQNHSSTFFAAIMPPEPVRLTRAVQVTCAKGNLFLAGLVAKHQIDVNGNGILTDSYSSQDPFKSVFGQYTPSRYLGDMGDIACDDGVVDSGSVNIGNGNIYGKAHIGPLCPFVVSQNGGVGTHAWQAAHGYAGVQPGYVIEDANFTFPDTSLPQYGSYLSVSNQPSGDRTIGTNIYTGTGYTTNSAYLPWPPAVGTNVINGVTTTIWPGPQPNLLTNTVPVANGTMPAPGTYIVSSLVSRPNNKWNYDRITGYQYTSISYTYNSYSTNTVYTTNHYDHILSANNNYQASQLDGTVYLDGPNITIVLPNGMTGSEKITWAQGAWVKMYVGGTTIRISGDDCINPNQGYSQSMIVFCSPTVQRFDLDGNAQFTGVLVAPAAALNLNGGGSSDKDFCGAIMCYSAKLNGHYKFHYDESLQGPQNNGRWLATSWNEVK